MDGEEMYSPEYEEDMSDAELDAIVAAAEDRLLTAIHDSLDLDAGLAKITPSSKEPIVLARPPSPGFHPPMMTSWWRMFLTLIQSRRPPGW